MVVTCCIINCLSSYTKPNIISFHLFPKDRQYKEAWIKFCQLCFAECFRV